MINETIDRIAGVADKKDIFIVTNEAQMPKMERRCEGRVARDHILAEPPPEHCRVYQVTRLWEILKSMATGSCVFPSDHFSREKSGGVYQDSGNSRGGGRRGRTN